ncbi:YesL family protein [Enterococcus casseliflavus]|uniref:YesL family protein n=1 Tax=Enterococcus casseliflavus TaxID=37734 RepID=UPI002FBD856F
MKFFLNFEGPVQRIFALIGDFTILNLFWLLCCLPVITIGASTTAMNYCTMRMIEGKKAYSSKDFFISFKKNFWQSTIAGLGVMIIIAFLYLDYQLILKHFGNQWLFITTIAFITILVAMELFYLFACIARFENTLKQHIKNAFFMSLANMKTSLISILLIGILIFIISNSVQILMLVFFVGALFGGASISYVLSIIWLNIFSKYENS